MKNYKKILKLILPVNLFLFLTVIFFSAMEVYVGNYNEFTFPFKQSWWIVLLFAFSVIIVFSILEVFISEKVVRWINVLAFALGICFYVQCMFLNGKMQTFTGENIVFDIKTDIINVLIWIVIISGICMLSKKEGFSKVVLFVSVGLTVIQSAGFITSAVSLPESDVLKQGYFSSDGEFELGSENNVIWFIIDGCDGKIVEETLTEKPDLFDGLNGFIYFPDNISCYSRTYPSIIYMFTNNPCYMDKPYEEYVSESWENTKFIPLIKSTGADVRIYTDPRYLGVSALDYVDNFGTYAGKTFEVINPVKLVNQMLHISLYRCMPYLLKASFEYNITILNSMVSKMPADTAIQFRDDRFYESLNSVGISANPEYNSALRFYHLWGAHPGGFLDADCNYKDGASEKEGLQASIKIINTYISQMKELGIYDESTIIVAADHGYVNASPDFELHNSVTSIMLVKPAGKASGLEESSDGVSHENLYNTILEVFGEYDDNYAKSVFSGDNTERTFWYTALTDDGDGEVAIREYRITGDARDFSNWKLTGNDYDIVFSERAVSTKRLKDK